jgi:hypothetical protein
MNQLQSNIQWTQRDNLHSVPTDCDQRTERQGWMADASGARFDVLTQRIALEDAIGSHACSLEASIRLTNDIHLGRPLPLTS